jgi:hypothetical protein
MHEASEVTETELSTGEGIEPNPNSDVDDVPARLMEKLAQICSAIDPSGGYNGYELSQWLDFDVVCIAV